MALQERRLSVSTQSGGPLVKGTLSRLVQNGDSGERRNLIDQTASGEIDGICRTLDCSTSPRHRGDSKERRMAEPITLEVFSDYV